jgi:TonB family protein
MDSILKFMAESAITLTILYIFYVAFLRNDTHFHINRFVLVFSAVISMLLPTVARMIDVPVKETLNLSIDFPQNGFQMSALEAGEPVQAGRVSFMEVLGFIYLIGAAIMVARLFYQAIYLHAVSRLSKTSDFEGFKIISLDTNMMPFSYFNQIFIPGEKISEESLSSIIAHEKSHLSQGHYIDLILFQIITVLQWFNPFVWFIEKSLKEVHEYLADEAVLESGKDMGKYQAVLVNEALGGPVFILTNQFNQSLIKKRILMMKNERSSKAAQLKALLLLPLMAGLLMAFANPPLVNLAGDKEIVVTGNVSDRFTGKPIAGANLVIKGTTIGTVADLQGSYKLIVAGAEDVIVVTFTGYRTQEIPVGRNPRINVQMEQDIVAIDFSKGNQFAMRDKSAYSGNEVPSEKLNKNQTSGAESHESFVFIEEMPTYPGGTDALNQFIHENLKYPVEAKKAGKEGTVLVSYVIDANGQIKIPQVVRGLDAEMDAEALRVTLLIEGWKPASQGGRPVATTVTMPVEFKIVK